MCATGRRQDVLILWDIDRTLVDVSDITLEAFTVAVTMVLGGAPKSIVSLTGRSEAASMFDSLRANGLTDEAAREFLPRALEIFVSQLADGMHRLATQDRAVRLLPGVRQALQGFAVHTSVLQSVLTGGVRSNAQLKINTFGLDTLFDLSAAAYGDDDSDRAALVDIARKRAAEAIGYEIPVSSTILIGDSLNDVDAGRRSGACVVGVGTGLNSIDELSNAGAHEVLPDLKCQQDLHAAVSRCLQRLSWP